MKTLAAKPSEVRRVDTGEIATQVIVRMLVERLIAHGDRWDIALTRQQWGRALHEEYFYALMTTGSESRLNQFNSSGGFLEVRDDGRCVVTNKLLGVCFSA